MEVIFANIQNDLFLEYQVFFRAVVFAQNWYNVPLDSFSICFWQFYILTQSNDFAKAIAFAWRPFLPIFQMVSFLQYIRCFFERFFAQKQYNILVNSFLICFWQFYFLTQSDILQSLQPLHGSHFCQYSKWSHFSNIRGFFERFFAQNQYNVRVDLFLICFQQFQILTQK